MNDELKEKMAKLPLWVREHIRQLQLRADPQIEEIVRLRKEVQKLEAVKRQQQDRIEAMVHMFQCAAKGGSELAAAVQRIVEDFLTTSE